MKRVEFTSVFMKDDLSLDVKYAYFSQANIPAPVSFIARNFLTKSRDVSGSTDNLYPMVLTSKIISVFCSISSSLTTDTLVSTVY